MTHRLLRFLAPLVGALLFLVIPFYAQSAQQPQGAGARQSTPEQQKIATAVRATRTINTAEISFKFQRSKNAGFASFKDLASAGLLGNGPTFNLSAPAEDAVPGYKLRLVVGQYVNAFDVALTDPVRCGTAVFSNETGVIFRGKSLGCEPGEAGSSGQPPAA